MRPFAVSLALALLVACGVSSDVRYVPPRTAPSAPTRTIPVLVDSAFGAADEAAIADAAAEWSRAFGGAIVLATRETDLEMADLTDRDSILVLRVDSSCTFIPHTAYATSENVLAWVNELGGRHVWVVRDRLGAWQLRAVVLHELGHVFGALDRESPGLMHRFFLPDEYRCVDRETAEAVSGVLGLPVGHCER